MKAFNKGLFSGYGCCRRNAFPAATTSYVTTIVNSSSKRLCSTGVSSAEQKESSSFQHTNGREEPPSSAKPSSPSNSKKAEEAALMQRMHMTMQRDSHAVRIHRELLLCLARGDAEGASDLAGLLAKRVGRDASSEEMKGTPEAARSSPNGGGPSSRRAGADGEVEEDITEKIPYSLSSLSDVTDKLSSTLAAKASAAATTEADASTPTPLSSLNLTITIIDSNFELEADEGAKADEKAMRVLSQYLEADAGAWRDQKRAVAKAVLDAAKQCGVNSDLLLQSDVAAGVVISPSFNPFSECNVMVRCEVPPPSSEGSMASIEEQLAEMRALPDWNENSEAIAKKELEMGLVSMRYKVGLHYSLEASLGPDRCAKFVSAAMRLLNEPLIQSSETYSHITIPAMPYTYMMRLCLWMEDPSNASDAL